MRPITARYKVRRAIEYYLMNGNTDMLHQCNLELTKLDKVIKIQYRKAGRKYEELLATKFYYDNNNFNQLMLLSDKLTSLSGINWLTNGINHNKF